jgi:hypothetical protein
MKLCGRSRKKGLKPWVKKKWCIPAVGAEFVWRMEDVRGVYARPYDPKRPQVCFDEKSVQLIVETRPPCHLSQDNRSASTMNTNERAPAISSYTSSP